MDLNHVFTHGRGIGLDYGREVPLSSCLADTEDHLLGYVPIICPFGSDDFQQMSAPANKPRFWAFL